MHLKQLKINNYRNLEDLSMTFSEKINCFVGENGVGKTNILDTIYYLSFCKSYFNTQDQRNIRTDQEYFTIHGEYDFEQSIERFSCALKKGDKKKFRCGDKDYNRFSEHIGKIPLVMITPSDQEIILGGSEVRRRFVDQVISQADNVYLDNLIQYNRAIEQRNKLLKYFQQNNSFDETSLSIWDEQMIRYGKEINKKRREFVEEIKPPFEYYYDYISSGKENIDIRYSSSNYEEDFEAILLEARQKDRVMGHSTVGVHRDDIDLLLDGINIKRYASQGQQKTFLLALKLAQFEYLYKHKKEKPILLMDDIFDKLDLGRIEQLINLVGSDRFGQVFLTDTQIGRVESIFENKDIKHKIYRYNESW